MSEGAHPGHSVTPAQSQGEEGAQMQMAVVLGDEMHIDTKGRDTRWAWGCGRAATCPGTGTAPTRPGAGETAQPPARGTATCPRASQESPVGAEAGPREGH